MCFSSAFWWGTIQKLWSHCILLSDAQTFLQRRTNLTLPDGGAHWVSQCRLHLESLGERSWHEPIPFLPKSNQSAAAKGGILAIPGVTRSSSTCCTVVLSPFIYRDQVGAASLFFQTHSRTPPLHGGPRTVVHITCYKLIKTKYQIKSLHYLTTLYNLPLICNVIGYLLILAYFVCGTTVRSLFAHKVFQEAALWAQK